MDATLVREREGCAEAARRKHFSAGGARGADIGADCRTTGPDLEGDTFGAAQAAHSNQQGCAVAFFCSTRHHLQKKACGRRSNSEPTWRGRAGAGSGSKACLTPPDWCLSTRLRSAPIWRGSGAGPAWREVDWSRAAWAMEDDHLRGRLASQPNDRADGGRGGHERRDVPGLCRAMLGSDAQAQRYRRDGQLAAHKVAGVREAIERAGATLRYLPKYSPDLNPIEMPYSKFKTFLRKAAERTVPRLYRAIRSFVPSLGARECANYFRHAGYASI